MPLESGTGNILKWSIARHILRAVVTGPVIKSGDLACLIHVKRSRHMHWLVFRQACVPRARLDTKHVIIMHCAERSVSHHYIVMFTLSEALAVPNPRICREWSLRLGIGPGLLPGFQSYAPPQLCTSTGAVPAST